MRIRDLFAAVISAAMCLQLTSVRVLSESNPPTESQPTVVEKNETPQPTNQPNNGPQTPVPTEVPLVEPSSKPTEAPVVGVTNSTQGERPEVKPQVRSLSASNLDLSNDTLDIDSKEDFLKIFNSEISNTLNLQHDEKRYGIRGKTINLNTDIVVSSDEINAQFPTNIKFKNYEYSFQLSDSDFHGQNHTITITQGNRNIYPLFGLIENSITSDGEKTIDNLTVNYQGDVYGSGFARYINASFEKNYLNFNNIHINVDGNILPVYEGEYPLELGAVKDSTPLFVGTMATGFAQTIDYAKINDIHINVQNNIGALKQPKFKEILQDDFYAKESEKYPNKYQDIVKSNAFGFTERYTFGNEGVGFVDLAKIDIDIGGSVIANGIYQVANAGLFGGHLGKMKMDQINLVLGQDVYAKISDANGDVLDIDDKYKGGTPDHTAYASGFAFGFHYLDTANIDIGGSIKYDNTINYNNSIAALGLNYDDDIPRGLEKIYSRTIKNVTLHVKGNVEALTDTGIDTTSQSNYPQVTAVAGAGNFDEPFTEGAKGIDFQLNNINIDGEVKAVANHCNGVVVLWGGLTGNNNELKASKLSCEAKNNGWIVVAPCYEVLNATSNTVIVGSIDATDMGNIYMAGFGYKVTSARDNKISIGDIKVINDKDKKTSNSNIKTKNATYFGGYTYKNQKNSTRPDVLSLIENENVTINQIQFDIPMHDCYLGGFITFPQEESTIENSKSNIGNINVEECKSISLGGFSSYSSKPVTIKNSKAHIGSIGVKTPGLANVGGFIGKATNLTVENSAALVDQDISVNGANWPNVGGFGGYIYNGTVKNSAAQIGGSMNLNESKGKAYAGGFIGHMYGSTIEKSSALTFGNITGNSDGIFGASAFVGTMDMNPNDASLPVSIVKESAAYLGGNIARADNIIPTGLCAIIANANISDFTLLVDKVPQGDKLKKEEYVSAINPNKDAVNFNNLYLVEVNGEKRTAYPLDITVQNDGSSSVNFKDKAGEIEIADRTFQEKFWGKAAVDTTKPGTFNYITKHDGVSALEFYTPDVKSLQKDDVTGNTLITDSFTTRHLSTMSNGITYDILGIKGIPSLTITYDANDATSGKVPVDEKQYAENEIATVLGNTNNLAKTGYEFAGWNTKADGTGKAYKQGDKITMVESLTLYAQWSTSGGGFTPSSKLIVRFIAEDGTPDVQTKVIYAGQRVAKSEVVEPIRAGYVFDGWYYYDKDEWKLSKPQGSDYLKQFSFDQRIYASIDIYAKWKKKAMVIPVVDDKKHVPPTSDGDACLFELP